MPKFETLPGERSASLISSIINLVCPLYGASMMEFQCNGRCGRTWLPEWEWGELYNHAVESRRRSQKETVRQRLLGKSIGKAHLPCH